METYILFYSNYCANCKEFIQSLYKSQYFEKFKKICVDNNPRIPKEITSIPAIIVPRMMKPLSGTEAFHWLRGMNQMQLQQQEKQINNSSAPKAGSNSTDGDPTNLNYAMGSVTAYSGTMDGFSDNFSFLGNDNPQEHSFSFLGQDGSKINTPQEGGDDPRAAMMSGGGSKSDFDKDFERLMASRSNDTPKPITRQ